jgi:hypothetical protein
VFIEISPVCEPPDWRTSGDQDASIQGRPISAKAHALNNTTVAFINWPSCASVFGMRARAIQKRCNISVNIEFTNIAA